MGNTKRQRSRTEPAVDVQQNNTVTSPSSSKRSKLAHPGNNDDREKKSDATSKKDKQRKPRKKSLRIYDEDKEDSALIERQDTNKTKEAPLPKGEEELLLEEELFGTVAPSLNLPTENTHSGSENENDDNEDEGDNEMGALLDDQLFVIDSIPAKTKDSTISNDSKPSSLGPVNARRRQSAWFDPADAMISVSLADASRLRKLRTSASEDQVGGVEYEARLRKQFEKMNPTPEWVKKSRKKTSKKDNADPSLDDVIDDALRIVSVDDRKKTSSADSSPLPQTNIDIERLRDANYAAPPSSKTNIQAIGFHPTLDILMSANEDRRLRLYNIDGEKNPFLQSVHVPELPITAAAFSPDGNSILMTGPRAFFYAYDLQAGHVFKSPRGLLNSGLGNSDGLGTFAFDPNSRAVAVAGRKGHVHLLDWARGSVNAGSGQVIGDLKANSPVKAISWLPSSSSSPSPSFDTSSKLMTLCEDGEAYIWDVGMRKCMGRWNDHGAITSTCLAIDASSKYVATGSTSGVVNVYDRQTIFPPSTSASVVQDPTPLKAIMNLTTAVTTMSFHPDSQLLALGSKIKKDALKLVHLPSMTVFSNWPKATTPLGHVRDIAFSSSRDQRYMAIGNDKGRILLYSLNHYARRHGSAIEL